MTPPVATTTPSTTPNPTVPPQTNTLPPVGVVPGWFFKLVALAILWAYLHHFIAGMRHLWMDINHAVSKEFGRSSAIVTLGLGTALTLVLGLKLFGAY